MCEIPRSRRPPPFEYSNVVCPPIRACTARKLDEFPSQIREYLCVTLYHESTAFFKKYCFNNCTKTSYSSNCFFITPLGIQCWTATLCKCVCATSVVADKVTKTTRPEKVTYDSTLIVEKSLFLI